MLRMKLVKSFCRVTIALIACSNISSAQVIPTPLLLDPYTQPKFVNPLPIPAVLTEKSRGAYTLQATQFTQHLGLFTPGTTTPLMTTVWGYNGTYPGPTIVATKGTPTRVYFPNRLTDKKKVPLPHLFPIDTTMMWAYHSCPTCMEVMWSLQVTVFPKLGIHLPLP
jgi:spore coat protein A